MKGKATACKALAAMVREHGAADSEEVRFVAHTALELGLDSKANSEVQAILADGGDFGALVAEVAETGDRSLQRFLFRRIVAAALLDEHVTDGEKLYIDRAATEFGYQAALVDEFVAWIREGIEWEKRGAELMERM